MDDDKDYRLNMPEKDEELFKTAFQSEGWSWSGLAELIKTEFPKNHEYKELSYFLDNEEE